MVFKKIIFQNRYVALETPPFMAKAILNSYFDYLNPSLIASHVSGTFVSLLASSLPRVVRRLGKVLDQQEVT